jgi:endonuclease/exonuclease/phosphatase family metal-dependent hydrolase
MQTDLSETDRNFLETNSGTGTLISYFGAGVIDEVVLVRKALTQAEIQESGIIQAPSKRKLIEGTENMSQQNPGKCIESHWTATKGTTFSNKEGKPVRSSDFSHFKIATYNVLANQYLHKGPGPKRVKDRYRESKGIVSRRRTLDVSMALSAVDLCGLQELEKEMAEGILGGAEERNLKIIWVKRPHEGKKDGVGILYNADKVEAVQQYVKFFDMDKENHGNYRLLQLVIFEARPGWRLAFFNVHIEYEMRESHCNTFQVDELFREANFIVCQCIPVFITGDFNTGPDRGSKDGSYSNLREKSGFAFSEVSDFSEEYTAKGYIGGSRRDFVFFSKNLASAFGMNLAKYEIRSDCLASDHFPLIASFEISSQLLTA